MSDSFAIVKEHSQIIQYVDGLQRKNVDALSFYPRQVFERESERGRYMPGEKPKPFTRRDSQRIRIKVMLRNLDIIEERLRNTYDNLIRLRTSFKKMRKELR